MGGPRLGFVGLGWIGVMRMRAVAGRAEVAALCDTSEDRLAEAGTEYPAAERFVEYGELLEAAGRLRLDGIVIATPNALHAGQTLAALREGLAVFCQKPLALNAGEAREMVDAARTADRLLDVDYSYRHTDGARALRGLIDAGELGRIFSVESVFHNAYGPDKAWCHDPVLAGGGALMDLGVHQIDLPLWLLRTPAVLSVEGCVFRDGEPLDEVGIDDFAIAHLELEGGARVQVAVSWKAHAGADCVIRTTVFGTRGGAELRNVDGSFYDFELVRHRGRETEGVVRESGEWLGRGIVRWAERLAERPGYDPEIESSIEVTRIVDAVYGRGAEVGRNADVLAPADA